MYINILKKKKLKTGLKLCKSFSLGYDMTVVFRRPESANLPHVCHKIGSVT